MIIWPVLSALLILTPGLADFAQAQNSTDSIVSDTKPLLSAHSVKKATLFATFIPGAGQAYNQKYWKIPIVYLGLTAASYALFSNQKNYRNSKNNYLALKDTLESTVNQSDKSESELLSDIDTYRRFRDLSVLGLIAWHGLTIIDANVDAHFFNWDVSEDLSLKIRPHAMWIGRLQPGIGLSFVINNN